MLTIFLTFAFVLGMQAGQTQANSGAQSSPDPSQMSLAERAAAARKASAEKANRGASSRSDGPPALTPEQRGTIQGNAYINNLLHFRVTLKQWQPLSAERVARDEDTARRMVNPDDRPSPFRVLWIGDSAGRNVAISIVPIPPEAPKDLKQLNESMKKIAIRQLALATELTESEEPFLLGDGAHPFAGFRVAATIQGKQLVQSAQLTVINGMLMTFTVTADSDQDLSDALRSLKASLAWTASGQ